MRHGADRSTCDGPQPRQESTWPTSARVPARGCVTANAGRRVADDSRELLAETLDDAVLVEQGLPVRDLTPDDHAGALPDGHLDLR